jgi:hypothetical protein
MLSISNNTFAHFGQLPIWVLDNNELTVSASDLETTMSG